MPEGPSLAITIVNHRQDDHLRECLESLRAFPYTEGPTEIVVLDNASMGTLGPLKADFPEVTIIEQPEWRGFGANQNRAISMTSGELVFVLNPDARVRGGCLEALATEFSNTSVAVAGGRLVGSSSGGRSAPPPVAAHSTRAEPFPTPASAWASIMRRSAQGTRPTTPVSMAGCHTFTDRWVHGAGMMLRRSAFDAVGGFDSALFMYFDEVDLQKRLVAVGYRVAFIGSAIVEHLGSKSDLGATSAQMDLARRVELYRAHRYYTSKHHGLPGLISYSVGSVLTAFLHLATSYLPSRIRNRLVNWARPMDIRKRSLRLLRAWFPLGRGIRDLAARWNSQLAAANKGVQRRA